jgi:hypothetical protein
VSRVLTRYHVGQSRKLDGSGIALQIGSLNSRRHCRPDEENAAELDSYRQGSAPFGDEVTVPLLVTRSRGDQLTCVRRHGGSLGENTQQPGGCLVDLTEIAASSRNDIGARAVRDVSRGGSHTGKIPIQLLSALAIISKSFAVFNFRQRAPSLLPNGTFPILTVAGFAVGDSLDVEDGVAAHPKTNPARNRRLKRRNAEM